MEIRLLVKPMCGRYKVICHEGHVTVTYPTNPKHKQH